MNAVLRSIMAMILIAACAQAEEFVYTPSPEVRQALRDQWDDINATLERSAAIRAEHARQQARPAPRYLPPEWAIDPRYIPDPPPLPPAMAAPPLPSMLRTPSGDLYYRYGNMIQGPDGGLYTIY